MKEADITLRSVQIRGGGISAPVKDKNRILSPREIENLIAAGHAVVIYENHVLRLNSWLQTHPGGNLAIFHMVGRDATDEMNAYHCDETVKIFKRFSIGKIDYQWVNMLPPIQGGVFQGADEAAPAELIGKQPVHIVPRVPQGVIPSLDKKELYTATPSAVRDPQVVIEEFDNDLVKLDLETLPSLDYATQLKVSKSYNALHKRIIDAGLYACPYFSYVKEFCRIGTAFAWCLIFLKLGHVTLAAFALGCAWQQAMFIAHDAGHVSITHNYQIDNVFGMTVTSWFGGLSLTWWKRNHNVHHLITNDPVHDPDIQHLPFFAVSSRLFGDVFSTYYGRVLWFDAFAKKMIPLQRYLYYPILAFGRFNLYRLSLEHLICGLGPRKGKAAWFRYYELVGLAFFWYWFGYLLIAKSLHSWRDRLVFIVVSHVATMIVHVQITLSHFAMSTSDLGTSESFAARQVRTTMDVDCPEWFDYFHGGLQFQTIHHLFPRLPRHNLRKAQDMVIQFCDEVGLRYSIYGFVTGNGVVLNKLGDVGKQVKILKDCLKNMQSEAVDGGNLYELKVKKIMEQEEAFDSDNEE